MSIREARLILARVYQGRIPVPYHKLREARIRLGIQTEEEL